MLFGVRTVKSDYHKPVPVASGAPGSVPGSRFAKLPLTVLADRRLSANARLVYAGLASYSNCQSIHPNLETLSDRCGLSVRSVQRGVRELGATGHVAVEVGSGRGRSNCYLLLEIPKGCPVGQVSGFRKPGQVVAKSRPTVAGKGVQLANKVDKEQEKETEKVCGAPAARVRDSRHDGAAGKTDYAAEFKARTIQIGGGSKR